MSETEDPQEMPPEIVKVLGRLERKCLDRERLERLIESGIDDPREDR